MTLYFEHSNGRRSLVAENVTPETAHEYIHADVKSRNPTFRIYYMLTPQHGDETVYDVGSHTEFYILKE